MYYVASCKREGTSQYKLVQKSTRTKRACGPRFNKVRQDAVNGNTSIVFAHPEALTSKEGRELI